MADEEIDTPMRTEDDSSDSGDSSSGEEEQVEWLVTGREKRATAGNRLGTLLQQAVAEDDELELLFAEEDDDAGFEIEEEDQSDVQMDSSSDDEDQGPTAGADDLEGEKELERQDKERRAKKRKLNDAIPKKFRQKLKIDPTIPRPPPRPKKKSERGSWIPTPEDAPTRASSRHTTKQSKEQLHAQMLDREKRRLKLLEKMEKSAKRKEADKPKALTQAERLEEAARIEKKNAKSLNRWEEAEKQREEEQRAKLAALNNRTLEGPVITWWSGKAEWHDGKLRKVGKVYVEDKVEKPKKRKAGDMDHEKTNEKAATAKSLGAQDGKKAEEPKKDDLAKNGSKTEGETSGPQGEAKPADPSKTNDNVPAEGLNVPTGPETSKKVDTASATEVAVSQKSTKSTELAGLDGVSKSEQSVQGDQPGQTEQSKPKLSSMKESDIEITEGQGSAQEATVQRESPKSTNGVGQGNASTENPSTESSTEKEPPEKDTHETNPESESSLSSDQPPTSDTTAAHENGTARTPASESAPTSTDVDTKVVDAPEKTDSVTVENTEATAPQVEQAQKESGDIEMADADSVVEKKVNGIDGAELLKEPSSASKTPADQQAAAPKETEKPSNTLPKLVQEVEDIPPPKNTEAERGPESKDQSSTDDKPSEQPETPKVPERPALIETFTRNALILQNFNEEAIKSKDVQAHLIFGRKIPKAHKPPQTELCVITALPAKYRDPITGLPYFNSYAFKEIQRAKSGQYRWSTLMGTYMGQTAVAARGVPERFLNPNGKRTEPKVPVQTQPVVAPPQPVGVQGQFGARQFTPGQPAQPMTPRPVAAPQLVHQFRPPTVAPPAPPVAAPPAAQSAPQPPRQTTPLTTGGK